MECSNISFFKWIHLNSLFILYVKELNALKILPYSFFFFKYLHFTVNIFFIVFSLIYSFIHM